MTDNSNLALSLKDVRKKYGDHEALKGVSIDVLRAVFTVYLAQTELGKPL